MRREGIAVDSLTLTKVPAGSVCPGRSPKAILSSGTAGQAGRRPTPIPFLKCQALDPCAQLIGIGMDPIIIRLGESESKGSGLFQKVGRVLEATH